MTSAASRNQNWTSFFSNMAACSRTMPDPKDGRCGLHEKFTHLIPGCGSKDRSPWRLDALRQGSMALSRLPRSIDKSKLSPRMPHDSSGEAPSSTRNVRLVMPHVAETESGGNEGKLPTLFTRSGLLSTHSQGLANAASALILVVYIYPSSRLSLLREEARRADQPQLAPAHLAAAPYSSSG